MEASDLRMLYLSKISPGILYWIYFVLIFYLVVTILASYDLQKCGQRKRYFSCEKDLFKFGIDTFMENSHHQVYSSIVLLLYIKQKYSKNNKTVDKNKKTTWIKLNWINFIHILKNIQTIEQGVVYCSWKRICVTLLRIIEEYWYSFSIFLCSFWPLDCVIYKLKNCSTEIEIILLTWYLA